MQFKLRKIRSDASFREFFRLYKGKKTSIIRPFNIYGPGMSFKDYRIIPNLTRSLFLNEGIKVQPSFWS